jgi:hypothetical protein
VYFRPGRTVTVKATFTASHPCRSEVESARGATEGSVSFYRGNLPESQARKKSGWHPTSERRTAPGCSPRTGGRIADSLRRAAGRRIPVAAGFRLRCSLAKACDYGDDDSCRSPYRESIFKRSLSAGAFSAALRPRKEPGYSTYASFQREAQANQAVGQPMGEGLMARAEGC